LGLLRILVHQSRSDVISDFAVLYRSAPSAPDFSRCLMHG
jgi:hypothetical protein